MCKSILIRNDDESITRCSTVGELKGSVDDPSAIQIQDDIPPGIDDDSCLCVVAMLETAAALGMAAQFPAYEHGDPMEVLFFERTDP